MKKLSKRKPNDPPFDWDLDKPSAALKARLRMVELPTDESRDLKEQFVFPCEDLWVPVSVVNGNVHILPGIPSLCKCRHPLFLVQKGLPLPSSGHEPS